MKAIEPIEHGYFYHIYNHGVGRRNLFCGPENYQYFLQLYHKHISPIAESYAWVLMKNHFHLLVRIKDHQALTGFANLSGLDDTKPPYQYFSNFFNAYTKAINKQIQTRGALFERPFKRKRIHNEKHLRQVVLYIHNNPVHHGFCQYPSDYTWSSYLTCIGENPTKLKRKQVMEWFGDKTNFKYMHNENIDVIEIERGLELE
ncbi:MAG: hypothetical protein K9H84_02490 [Bacteroidales bacterium]|nr:hypothetical protein [Bacteroidales bacterium]